MKITEQIHAVKHYFQIPLPNGEMLDRFVYSYIIFGDYITLIDTGVKESYKTIYNYIITQNRSIDEIDRIILSHAHPDHIGSAFQIKKDTNCIIFAHEEDLNWFENIEIQFNSRAVPGFFQLVDKAVEVDVLIEDGDSITPPGVEELQILHTPGHSPGSVSIYFSTTEVLFTGDAIPVENDIPNYDSYFMLYNSLLGLKAIPSKVLLTSWTDPVFVKKEMKQFYENALNYLNKIDEAVKKFYTNTDDFALENCQRFVKGLGLPDFFINPIVNRALRTHL